MADTGAKAGASTPKGERRAHFRGGARAGRRVELHYKRKDGTPTRNGNDLQGAVTGNIGVGGAFVLISQPEDVGSELVLELRMPEETEPLLIEATVRWQREGAVDDGAGMGLKFAPLDVPVLLALQEYFSSLAD